MIVSKLPYCCVETDAVYSYPHRVDEVIHTQREVEGGGCDPGSREG